MNFKVLTKAEPGPTVEMWLEDSPNSTIWKAKLQGESASYSIIELNKATGQFRRFAEVPAHLGFDLTPERKFVFIP